MNSVKTEATRDLTRPCVHEWTEKNNDDAVSLASALGVEAWMSTEMMHATMSASKLTLSKVQLASKVAQLKTKDATNIPEMSSASEKRLRTVMAAVRTSHKNLSTRLGDGLEGRVESVRQHVEALAESVASTIEP